MIAVSIVLFIVALHMGAVDILKLQDPTPVAKKIKELQDNGEKIAVCGKYHGEYNFLGRLEQAPYIVRNRRKSVEAYVKKYPDSLFVYKVKKGFVFKGFSPLYSIPLRESLIIFVRAKDFITIY